VTKPLHGIKARTRRRFKATTESRHNLPVAANLLQREFLPARPDQVWTTDITYLWIDEGWLYFTVILDLFSRPGVGWSLKPHMSTELVSDALRMTWFRRRPEAGLIVHSDSGSQYCSRDFPEHAQGLWHAQLDEPSRKLSGQFADREPVGFAQASAHPRPALCDASRGVGRGA
jgi:putative transposase